MKPGWTEAALGDICEFRYGKALKADDRTGSGWPVYGSNGVVGMHEEVLTTGPAIVIGRKGSYGEVHYSEGPAWTIDTTYYVDSTCSQCDLRWLSYRMADLGLTELNRAAAVPGLNRDDAYRRRLLLPPLDEQRRIVRVLDAANVILNHRRRTIWMLDDVIAAAFAREFGRWSTDGWPVLPIGALCTTTSGGTPERGVAEYYGGDIPWVKSGELRRDVVLASEEYITERGARSSGAKLLQPGTVLVAMYGATAGVVSELGIDAATNQAVCALVPGNQIRTPYLVSALRASTRDLLVRRAGGAQPNLSQSTIRNHRLPVPPLDVQDRFGSIVQAVRSRRRSSLRHLSGLSALVASLQHRAFTGAL